MTIRKRVLTAALALTLGAAATAAADTGPYIGGSVGQTRVEIDPTDVPGAGFRVHDEDFAYKIFFGWELPGPLALEGGFRELGKVTDDDGLRRVTSESDGFDAFVLGKLPLGPVSLFAKGGIIFWDTEFESRRRGGVGIPDVRITDDGTDFAWGLGIGFEIGRFGFRGEYEKFEIDLPDDLTMLSVGVTFEF